MIELSGVFAPVTTPFDPDSGEIDPIALRANVAVLTASALAGFVVFGTTGEGPLLDDDERAGAIDTVRSRSGALLVLAATGAESTRATVRRCRGAANAGADAVLVAPPFYYRPQMTSDALLAHYRAVADQSPVPVVLYQVPRAYASVELTTELVARLAEHPNIVGIKDSAGDLDLLSDLVASCGSGFAVLVGSGEILHGALRAGAVGGILAVADLAPGLCRDVFRFGRSGDHDAAALIQARLSILHRKIVAGHGVPGIKAALDLLGQAGGPPRPPLPPLGEVARAEIAAALAEAGLLETVPTTDVHGTS
jgi:4-hydroxy-2-oxoglutarate aldolase